MKATKFITFDYQLKRWTIRLITDEVAGRLLFSSKDFKQVKDYAEMMKDYAYDKYSFINEPVH